MADNNNFQRKRSNPVTEQIPEALPEVGLSEFDAQEASQFAQNFVADFKESTGNAPTTAQVENATDLKKMERMAKGMSVEQQEAMARHFDHYALLSALHYQFKNIDKFEADLNGALTVLAKSREEL